MAAEVVAAFQPIFDLRDGCVVGYEALARPARRLVAQRSCSPPRASEGRLAEVDRECRAAALRAGRARRGWARRSRSS